MICYNIPKNLSFAHLRCKSCGKLAVAIYYPSKKCGDCLNQKKK